MRHSLFIHYLNDDAIQYNLAAYATLVNFQYNLAAYATLVNFHRLCWILYTCYDVIVIVKSEKAEVNAV